MKILAINGSPHKDGNTYKLINEIFRGAKENNYLCEIVHLVDLNLDYCNWYASCAETGIFTTDDGFQEHLQQIFEADILPSGNMLIALQWTAPNHAVELNMSSHNVIWSYSRDKVTFARDAARLPNGNALIQAVVGRSPKIYEVTPSGEIVWQLAVREKLLSQLSPGWFYKAQRT